MFVPLEIDCTRLATFQSRYAIPVTVAFAVEPVVVGCVFQVTVPSTQLLETWTACKVRVLVLEVT